MFQTIALLFGSSWAWTDDEEDEKLLDKGGNTRWSRWSGGDVLLGILLLLKDILANKTCQYTQWRLNFWGSTGIENIDKGAEVWIGN